MMNEESVDGYDEAEDDDVYRLTPAGYRQILGWVKFQSQLCEFEHGEDPENCNDETHQVAFLMCFVLLPVMNAFDIPTSGPIDTDGPVIEKYDEDSSQD